MEDNQPMDIDAKLHEIEMLKAQKPLTLEQKLRMIDLVMGLTAGGPSGCDLLLEDRGHERERALVEDGW